jgi:hypothetical protein
LVQQVPGLQQEQQVVAMVALSAPLEGSGRIPEQPATG